MKMVFLSFLSSTPGFLSRPVSHTNNSSKTLVNLKKFPTEKHTSQQLALNLRKIRQRIFLLFDVKDFLNTGKNSWKTPNSTSKCSILNHFQLALLTSYGGKASTHWNKKPFRGVFRTQSKIYNGTFFY